MRSTSSRGLSNAASTRATARRALAFGSVLHLLGTPAAALAAPYPTQVITLVAPFAAGGPTERMARILAEALSQTLHGRVIVETVGGAGGTVGAARVAHAPGDGYTLLLHHDGHAIAPLLYSRLSYDPVKDFAPIGAVVEMPMMLVGRADLPAPTFRDLASWLRDQGARARYAHAGPASASHLCGLLLESSLGTKMTEVAYKGTARAIDDLAKGRVDVMCDQSANTIGFIVTGRVKAYAVTSPTRMAGFDKVPTLDELGLNGFDLVIRYGLYAPRTTPSSVVAQLSQALLAALGRPTLRERLAQLGATPVVPASATPELLRAKLAADSERWRTVVRVAEQSAD